MDNFCSWENNSWKNPGLFGIRTFDLCDRVQYSTKGANKTTGSWSFSRLPSEWLAPEFFFRLPFRNCNSCVYMIFMY